jgi:methyl-accepting chemotaxis protein
MSAGSNEREVLVQQFESVGSRLLVLEARVTEVEAIITRLEAAAETMGRALDEIASHWDAVYRAMRRAE